MRNPVLASQVLRRFISTSGKPICAPATSTAIPFGGGRQKSENKRGGFLKWTAISLGIGTAAGLALGYDQIKKMRTLIANPDDDVPFLLSEVPEHKPSRTFIFPADTTGLKLTLFQYQTCPFCCKARAMLDYFGISYNVVEVNPVLRSQIKWSKTYKKVPILVVETPEGEVLQLNDSSMIVSALYSYLLAKNQNNSTVGVSKTSSSEATNNTNTMYSIAKCYPTMKFNDDDGKLQTEILNRYFLMLDGNPEGLTKEQIIEERKWRKWADTVYVHTLSPNIYRTLDEAIASFKNFDKVGEWEKNFALWERYLVIYVGAMAMWMIGKRLQKRHNLKNDVRQSLFEESDYWITNIKKKGGNYMGGSKPNLSDLAVYGVLNSIQGCAAFNDLMEHSPEMRKWYMSIQSQLHYYKQENELPELASI